MKIICNKFLKYLCNAGFLMHCIIGGGAAALIKKTYRWRSFFLYRQRESCVCVYARICVRALQLHARHDQFLLPNQIGSYFRVRLNILCVIILMRFNFSSRSSCSPYSYFLEGKTVNLTRGVSREKKIVVCRLVNGMH